MRYRILALSLLVPVALLMTTGCGSDEDFSYPVEQTHLDPDELVAGYAADLLAPQNGWEGVLTPANGRIYKLHVVFETGSMNMLADVDTVSALEVSSSVYTMVVKNGQPVIQFSNGSQLDRMQTPDNSDGVDKEYTIKGKEGNSLVLQGNSFGDKLILSPSKAEFAQKFREGEVKKSIKGITRYLPSVRTLYFEPEPGKKIQFVVRSGLRSTYFTYVENEKAQFFGSDYLYTSDGIQLRTSAVIHGVDVKNLNFDTATNKFYVIYNGIRIDAIESPMPVIPLHYLLGNEFESGAQLVAPWLVQQPGWSYKFKEAWALTEYDLDESEYGLTLLTIVIDINPDNNTMKLVVQTIDLYGRSEYAEYPYKFSKSVEGVFSFEPLPVDVTTTRGQYADDLREELSRLLNIIDDYTYSIDFYEYAGDFMAGYQSQEDIEMFFTGNFY